MNFTIDTSEIQRLVDQLQDTPRQARFAGALALTKTAKLVRTAERHEMRDVFDRPTRWTVSPVDTDSAVDSLYLKAATKDNLTAEVGIKDSSSGVRPAIKWLQWQINGGQRTRTGLEKLLNRAGAMRGDQYVVPGRFARLDAFGNISRGQIVQILSQLRIDTYAGSSRALPRPAAGDTPKDLKRKAGVVRRAYNRAGGQYVAFPNGRGKLRPGIYLVRQFAAGRSDPRPVLIFVTQARYEAERLDFHYVAATTINRHLVAETQAAVQHTLLTARPSGAGQ